MQLLARISAQNIGKKRKKEYHPGCLLLFKMLAETRVTIRRGISLTEIHFFRYSHQFWFSYSFIWFILGSVGVPFLLHNLLIVLMYAFLLLFLIVLVIYFILDLMI